MRILREYLTTVQGSFAVVFLKIHAFSESGANVSLPTAWKWMTRGQINICVQVRVMADRWEVQAGIPRNLDLNKPERFTYELLKKFNKSSLHW